MSLLREEMPEGARFHDFPTAGTMSDRCSLVFIPDGGATITTIETVKGGVGIDKKSDFINKNEVPGGVTIAPRKGDHITKVVGSAGAINYLPS